MTRKDYQEILPTLPTEPGVYQFIDSKGSTLYVGKAKNLKNRISSYFTAGQNQANKTRVMVRNAQRIEYTLVQSEQDALLLENTLIKKIQPRYNVSLKDGKTYSYLCIKKERFPRVFFTRKIIRDGSLYFGPYTSKWRTKILLELIKSLFPLRTCTLNLSSKNIEQNKFKVCLEYHIKNCLGPCVGYESEDSYQEKIEQIKNILKGNFAEVKAHMAQQMLQYAENLEFEKAQEIKEKMVAFEDYQSKSTIVSTTIKDVDVFAIAQSEGLACINYLKVVNGAIINTYTIEVEKNLNEEEKYLLEYAIPTLREQFNSIAPEILLPFEVNLAESVLQTVPKIGDKKKLWDLSMKNAKYFLLQRLKEKTTHSTKPTPAERILNTLKKDLQLNTLPLHIECFDNSNFQGSYPVGSCVVFKNAKPAKKDYRKFNIKTVVGPDDFASMKETVYRRYKRLLEENQPLPQLVIIDGGKGQLSAAYEIFKALNIEKQVALIGIAKRLEEIFFPNDSIPLYINKKSESLKLIQQLRNEAHRFAIGFHRDQRSKDFAQSSLSEIPGVGKATEKKLLSHFKSLHRIKAAKVEELEVLIGKKLTEKIRSHFSAEENQGSSPSSEEP
jgi:excinuclease ABC subunit C